MSLCRNYRGERRREALVVAYAAAESSRRPFSLSCSIKDS